MSRILILTGAPSSKKIKKTEGRYTEDVTPAFRRYLGSARPSQDTGVNSTLSGVESSFSYPKWRSVPLGDFDDASKPSNGPKQLVGSQTEHKNENELESVAFLKHSFISYSQNSPNDCLGPFEGFEASSKSPNGTDRHFG